MLELPENEYHMANASIYLVVWWVVMVPRFLLNVRVRLVLRVST
jgi:predicted secreted protein